MDQQALKSNYLDAIKLTLSQQVPWFVLCALLLDGGKVFRVCLIAMLGFWLFAMLCLARSQRASDPLGLLFIRWGFFPTFGLLLFLNGYLHPEIRH